MHEFIKMTTKKTPIGLSNELLTELNKRIGVMISLLLRIVQQEKSSISLKDQVRILDNLGLRPRDIAAILGRTPTYINKELVGIRKQKVLRKNKGK